MTTPRHQRTRLRLDPLEDRAVPSTVTNLLDSGPGSLRDAIAGTPAGGTVDFQPGLTGTITLTSGELAIDNDLTITGPGAGVLAVSGNNASRIFTVDDESSGPAVEAAIAGLTLTGGRAPKGGAVLNREHLTLTGCTLTGNAATTGGGILNAYKLELTGCTLWGNSASSGGGIANSGLAQMLLTNCTLVDNAANYGGGIYNSPAGLFYEFGIPIGGVNGGSVALTSCTLSGNSAAYHGGGIYNPRAVVDRHGFIYFSRVGLTNTIVDGSVGEDVYDPGGGYPSPSGSHNLIEDGSGGLADSITGDPRIGPLQDNGGPTPTLALLPGSPAIGLGDPARAPPADQRDFPRPAGGPTDLGAYQTQPPVSEPDSYSTAVGAWLAVPAPGVLANDADPDHSGPLSAAVVTPPPAAEGALYLNPDGSFAFAPAAGFVGTTAFTYRVTDGVVAGTPTTVTVTVANLPPVVRPDGPFDALTGRQLVVPAPGVLANDADPDGDPLAAAVVTPPPASAGTLVLNPEGSFVFTPTAGFTGATAFTYRATDGTAASEPVAVDLHVRPAAEPAAVGGSPDGTARLLTPTGGQYDLGNTLTVFPDFAGVVRTAVADVTGDGVPDFIGGAGHGGGPRVVILDGATGARVADFFAFEPSFIGGVFVAAGDLDGDGKAEVVVTPDDSGGPVVAVYSGAALAAGAAGDAAQLARFAGIDDPAFRGGARAALGDVNGDGAADLVVAAGSGGGPRVAMFDGRSVAAGGGPVKLVADFFAFEPGLRNGAFVAAGDLDGDGSADLALGSGAGGAPRVRVVSGRVLPTVEGLIGLDPFLLKPPGLVGPSNERLWDLAHPIPPGLVLADLFADDPALRAGVRVAVKDADGDGRADLVTGSGEGEPSRVRVYRADTLLAGGTAPDQVLDPFGAAPADGVFVG